MTATDEELALLRLRNDQDHIAGMVVDELLVLRVVADRAKAIRDHWLGRPDPWYAALEAALAALAAL